jgi:hypothetical protein
MSSAISVYGTSLLSVPTSPPLPPVPPQPDKGRQSKPDMIKTRTALVIKGSFRVTGRIRLMAGRQGSALVQFNVKIQQFACQVRRNKTASPVNILRVNDL